MNDPVVLLILLFILISFLLLIFILILLGSGLATWPPTLTLPSPRRLFDPGYRREGIRALRKGSEIRMRIRIMN